MAVSWLLCACATGADGARGAGLAPAPSAQPGETRGGALAKRTAASGSQQLPPARKGSTSPAAILDSAHPAGMRCLAAAYPDHVCGLEDNTLVMCDGTRLRYDDGRDKTPEARIADADLEDQMAQQLTKGPATGAPPPAGFDPGRARHAPLFEKMYGADAQAVGGQLREVTWLSGRKLRVTGVNGVDARLRAVADELRTLSPALRRIARKSAGTFNWRTVRGTQRRSAHGYGIAIDVASARSDYWRWREPSAGGALEYHNRVPMEIVHAFERQGFLWGGRWYHYDTMHFEYRPELFIDACRDEPPATATGPAPRAKDDARSAPSTYAFDHVAGPHNAESLLERVAAPAGFARVALDPGGFGHWLRHLPLKAGRGRVMLHDGSEKGLQSAHEAIVDIDVGTRDLQQCADAVMRLRAEYLWAANRRDEICFEAVSGQPLPYRRWRAGERPPRGRAHPWRREAAADASHASFRRYMDRVFGIANTASLRRELAVVDDPKAVEPGDVYIQGASGGYFGHAVLVLDVAEASDGARVFLIAQSYMPAQDIHVLRNWSDDQLSPWYRPTPDGSLATPEWSFPPDSLRRFAASCR